MSPDKTISIIGSGNVGTRLGHALKESGYTILEVHSTTFENASRLAQQLDATPIAELEKLSPSADLFLISVSDRAYGSIAHRFPHKDKLIAHTSGSLSIDILQSASSSYGSLYPLQTFSKEKTVQMATTPFLVNGKSPEDTAILEEIAHSLSGQVHRVSDAQKKQLHLAAVFACNFSNHMLTIAKDIANQHDIDFTLLHPLIGETINKALSGDPATSQTGPASRKDYNIIEDQLKNLDNSPNLQEIYQLVSENIIRHP